MANLSRSQKNSTSPAKHYLRHDTRVAILVSMIAGIMIIIAVYLTGRSSSYESRNLLEGMLPSVRFLTSSVMTVTATVLALMLTLISFTYSSEFRIKEEFYQRIRLAALVTTCTFIFATMVLAVSSIPFHGFSVKRND